MKNIILQHWSGELNELCKLSQQNIQRYAKKIGADYKLVTGSVFRKESAAPLQKLFMLDESWDSYDGVLMIDMDAFIPRTVSINVFEESGVGVCNERIRTRAYARMLGSMPRYASKEHPYWGGAIYKLDLDIRKELRSHLKEIKDEWRVMNGKGQFQDEGIMHRLAILSDIRNDPSLFLDDSWCMDNYYTNVKKANMIHVRKGIRTSTGSVLGQCSKLDNYKSLVNEGIL